MTKLWWAQIKAVIRLEMKKTFFARRGLWQPEHLFPIPAPFDRDLDPTSHGPAGAIL